MLARRWRSPALRITVTAISLSPPVDPVSAAMSSPVSTVAWGRPIPLNASAEKKKRKER
jgi:hypothetical protein